MDHSDKKGKNIIDIQESNRSLVLQILTENDICTRVQIAEQTGLQQASITKIIREFTAAGIVSEVCMMTGKKGRRSIGLRLNSHLFKVIGVKISKNVCPIRTARFTRNNRIMEGHMQAVRYIVRISV